MVMLSGMGYSCPSSFECKQHCTVDLVEMYAHEIPCLAYFLTLDRVTTWFYVTNIICTHIHVVPSSDTISTVIPSHTASVPNREGKELQHLMLSNAVDR